MSAACRGTRSVQTMRRIVTSPVANQDMKKRTEYLGSFLLVLVRTTGLVVSEASVIAERANLFAEVIVYAKQIALAR